MVIDPHRTVTETDMERGTTSAGMTRRGLGWVAALVMAMTAIPASAMPLIDRGTWYGTDGTDGTLRGRDALGNPVSMLVGSVPNPDMKYVYDTVLDLTWLANWNWNFNGLMNWTSASSWAANLMDFGGGWALPSVLDTGPSGCQFANAGTGCGYNVYGSEVGRRAGSPLAHMYYDTLGNKGYLDVSGNVQNGWGPINTGPFSNIQFGGYQGGGYWSGTVAPVNGAWYFYMEDGSQSGSSQTRQFFAVAVRPGDVFPVLPPPPPPPPLNFQSAASTNVSGSFTYSVGAASGQANESNASATGERIELSLVRQGYGYDMFASAEGGFLKAYAESVDAGANGSSSASASATWTDYFLITGAPGSAGMEATALVTASVDGMIAGRSTDGTASFSFTVTFDPANPCLASCGLSDTTQGLAQESRSVTGRRSVSVDTVFETEFTFRYGTPFRIAAALTTTAANGGMADFGHTGTFGLTIPSGAQVVTASGIVYGPTAPIPEPSTYAMLGVGLIGLSLAVWRRRSVAMVSARA
jgi:hypothetical protein